MPGNKYDKHNLYVGWNVAPYSHEVLIDQVASENHFAVYTPLIDADEVTEIIPSGSVNTAVMANVFGEPLSDKRGRYHNTSKTEEKLDSLGIVRELLADHGEIVIIETITPEFAAPFATRETATKTLEAAGFTTVVFLPASDPEYKSEMRRFNHFNNVSRGESFMVTALKA